jgi:ribose transport system permease protein
MTTSVAQAPMAPSTATPGLRVTLGRSRSLLTAAGVLLLLIAAVDLIGAKPLSYFDFTFLASGGATLALASVGETLIILTGGFDLSAGAVVSLVNVVLATSLTTMSGPAAVIASTVVGIGVGMVTGLFNGFFVAVLGLQSIVVTLSTMFILQGVTLLVMDKPGGVVSPDLGAFYLGDAVPNFLPMPVVLLALVAALWLWVKRTPFGKAIFAVGSDPASARAAGIRVNLTRLLVYTLAGGCYGLAGVFITAQTGSGDPLVGNSLLLSIFTAVVVGGTRLGGGLGSPIASMLGAFILMIVVNVLLLLNVSAYYATIAQGAILILAVLAASANRDSVVARKIRTAHTRFVGWRAGQLTRQLDSQDRRLPFARLGEGTHEETAQPTFFERYGEMIRYGLPAYVCFAIVVIVTQLWLGNAITHWSYWNSLIVLSSFLAVLAFGQGSVILTGGLDLSVPWTIGLCGIVVAGLVQGSDLALVYALPIALLIAAAVGLANGVGITVLGLSPIVMTLATDGVLQGIALIYSGGTPSGFSSPMLRAFMTGRIAGVTPVVFFTIAFAAVAVIVLTRTPFGRRVYAIGNGVRAAEFSGVPVDRTIIGVYVVSALCSGIVGILLTGFSGQASLGMGDDYLLPSIAVVVVGGALITGGRGHYLGMLGGVLLLTGLQTLLAGSNLPFATRAIVYGCVVLGAVIALRDRRSA